MPVPTPEQIAADATGPRADIMYAASQMTPHECALFFSLLSASFAARALGPPDSIYPELRMGARSPLVVKL